MNEQRSVTEDGISGTNQPHRQVVIEVSKVGKCYQIYDRPEDRLKQAIMPRLHRFGRPIVRRTVPAYYREFWALRDVSFEVRRGEFVGIIGRNGAGKSTLLQVIVGTVAPTTGSVKVSGRIAALLELGSGFNPDFTGRENVYLNASLLGLSTAQIDARFDEIKGFADIGEFIDQPVKNYSSGMMMRLAFAVQTAVEPAILIVDEALAVGDVFFQAKCMARLRRLVADGVTILLVTHDVATVRQMCDRVLLLQHGRLLASGSPVEVTDSYLRLELDERNRAVSPCIVKQQPPSSVKDQTGRTELSARAEGGSAQAVFSAASIQASPQILERKHDEPAVLLGAEVFDKRASINRTGNGDAQVINVQMLKHGDLCDVFDFGDTVTLRQVIHFRNDLRNVNVSYKIRTVQGIDVVFADTRVEEAIDRSYSAGHTYVLEWRFRLWLMHGNYGVMTGVAHPPDDRHDDWIFIDMVPFCFDFRMAPRKGGMIDGFVTWRNELSIIRLSGERARAAGI